MAVQFMLGETMLTSPNPHSTTVVQEMMHQAVQFTLKGTMQTSRNLNSTIPMQMTVNWLQVEQLLLKETEQL